MGRPPPASIATCSVIGGTPGTGTPWGYWTGGALWTAEAKRNNESRTSEYIVLRQEELGYSEIGEPGEVIYRKPNNGKHCCDWEQLTPPRGYLPGETAF